jgi:hypothetical protein
MLFSQGGAHSLYRPQDWKHSKCRETLNEAGGRQQSQARGADRLSLRGAFDKVRHSCGVSTLVK